MFFLYNMFQDQHAISTTGNVSAFDSVQVSRGIFDHLNILNIIYDGDNSFSDNKADSPTEHEVLNVSFDGTTDGGELSKFIAYVDYIAVQRKEKNSDEWITLQKIYKNKSTGEIITNFIIDDTLAQNNTEYIYRFLPFDNNGNEGVSLQQDILSIFNEAYIADANHIYKITNEYQLAMQKNQKSTIYEPYGAKYPFVVYNADTNYYNGSITALLLAETSNGPANNYLDRHAQMQLVSEFNSWLANGEAKILKDFNGNFKIISIINPIANNYYKELGNGLASTSFDFVEIAEMKQKYLDKIGLLNKFEIKNKN